MVKALTPLISQLAEVVVASTASETSLLNATQYLPANFFYPGKVLRFRAAGFYSTTGTPTLQFKLKLGSTVILDSTALTKPSGASNQGFLFEGQLVCKTQGASGNVWVQGELREPGATTNAFALKNTAVTSLDTTAAWLFDLTATWGTSSSSNTITCSNALLEMLDF